MIRTHYSLFILGYCAAIFWCSHQPQPVNIEVLPGLDKLVHMAVYGGLAALVSLALRRSNTEVHPILQFLGPLGFALLYGLFDEAHQYFVPTRSFDPLDLIADAFGALAVQWFLCRIPIGRQVQ
ncbi:MAG: VanZ family protein [Candidatus Hydrogenedentes bacterium]|nr:VanZ family protein [Candidatus Hydrogenedentota bacterium]